jgi:hypothetical protein
MAYLKEVDDAHLSKDSMGQRLVYGDLHIICENDRYLLRNNETKEIVESYIIKQNEDGIDSVDRIQILKDMIVRIIQIGQKGA